MSAPLPHSVFDGHNDAMSRLWRSNTPEAVHRFVNGDPTGHIDLPRAQKGGLAGGLCALYVPSERDGSDPKNHPSRETALDVTTTMAGLLVRCAAVSDGAMSICHSAADIRSAMAQNSFAAVMHLEGAEAIGADLNLLYLLHAAGLRTLGPVWSRPNIFGFGVPFRFPHSPDIGPGLTDPGKALVRACNELKIMVDLSHLNEAGFWEVAKLSDAPLIASHSNAHAICAHSRNLTDRQLDAIRDTGGLVGINFGIGFLSPDGESHADMPLRQMVDHVDYIVERIGVDHVALGSDFDGTTIADAIGDCAGLPALIEALRAGGYDGDTLAKITHKNWLRVLQTTWGG